MARKKTPEPSPAIAGESDGDATPDVAFLDVSGPTDAAGAVADLADDPEPQPGADPMPPPDGERKRKRGRPKGSGRKAKEPEPEPDPQEVRDRENDVAEALTGTLLMVSALAVAEAPEFALSEIECKLLGGLWAPCLAPHMGALGAALPWAVAAAGTARILLPRYQQYRRRMDRGETLVPPPGDVEVTDRDDIQPEGVGK